MISQDHFNEIREESLTGRERNFQKAAYQLDLRFTGTIALDRAEWYHAGLECEEERAQRFANERCMRMLGFLAGQSRNLFLTSEGCVALGTPHRQLLRSVARLSVGDERNLSFLSSYHVDRLMAYLSLKSELPYGATLFRVDMSRFIPAAPKLYIVGMGWWENDQSKE